MQIIVKPSEIPNNPKLTNFSHTVENIDYKVILGTHYIYLLDNYNATSHKVKQTITLLNLFSNALSNKEHRETIIKELKEISLQETKDNYIKRFINVNK